MARQFSKETLRLALQRSGRRCEYIRDGRRCNAELTPGNCIYDHNVPWALCCDSSLGNCQVICVPCNREKTSGDATSIAKMRRQADFNAGITGPGLGRSPMSAGRLSRLKKTFRHGVVPRLKQTEMYRRLMRERFPGWQP